MKLLNVAILLLLAGCTTTGSRTSYDSEEIKKTIAQNMQRFRACYSEFTLITKSKRGGKIELNWDIKSNGSVENIMVTKSLEPTLDECVVTALKQIRFQEPPSGQIIRVTYPFSFVYKEPKSKSAKN